MFVKQSTNLSKKLTVKLTDDLHERLEEYLWEHRIRNKSSLVVAVLEQELARSKSRSSDFPRAA